LFAEKLAAEEQLKRLANQKRETVPVKEVDSDEQPLTTPAPAGKNQKRQRANGPLPSANEVDNTVAAPKSSLGSAFKNPAKAAPASTKVPKKATKDKDIPQQHKASQERIQQEMAKERENKTSPLVPFGPVIGAKVAARLPSGAGIHFGVVKKIHPGKGDEKQTFTVEFEDGEVVHGLTEGLYNKLKQPNKPMTLVPYHGEVTLQKKKK
jgi:hypothetical protein